MSFFSTKLREKLGERPPSVVTQKEADEHQRKLELSKNNLTAIESIISEFKK